MAKIYIGSDHAGFPLKDLLFKYLEEKGEELVDIGVNSASSPTDYPDIARDTALKVKVDKGSLGILVCGTGIGMAITANKINGIRAAHVGNATEARFARLHNDANIITFGQRIIGFELAKDIVDTFLSTEFEGGRHSARIEKIKALEHGE